MRKNGSLALLSCGWLASIGFFVAPVAYAYGPDGLGATLDSAGDTVTFRVYSGRAARLEAWIYASPFGETEKMRLELTPDSESKVWAGSVSVSDLESAGIGDTIYYGYRAWGPNWIHDPEWSPGESAGFVADVDAQGNRFNPNKLLLDPYALEVSHDLRRPGQPSDAIADSGARRNTDTGEHAPKGIVLAPEPADTTNRPTRPFKDEIIYEVHVRGLTMNDPSVPADLRGTYAGAALKAPYLKSLGVTAVEFLPVQEFQNDHNDIALSTRGDNYWGYDPINYFAPDRRYAPPVSG